MQGTDHFTQIPTYTPMQACHYDGHVVYPISNSFDEEHNICGAVIEEKRKLSQQNLKQFHSGKMNKKEHLQKVKVLPVEFSLI